MGRAGPKPKPAELARADGTYRADRHGEVVVLGGRLELVDLECPESLVALDRTLAAGLLVHHGPGGEVLDVARPAPSAALAWDDVAGPLAGADLVQRNDLPALEMMATALHAFRWAEWELELHVRATGRMTYSVGTNGALAPHPSLAIRDRAAKEFQSWAARFGATPSDRVALGIGAVKGRTMAASLEDKIGKSPRNAAAVTVDPLDEDD